VLEPPSSQLLALLRELRLCTPRELRRCRGRVRRLARDLPAFDSIWIDALVQLRCLTPFQARVLESSEPERLKVGPCVLVDRLGAGLRASTYIARPIAGHELCVLKLIQCEDEYLPEVLTRFRRLLGDGQGFAHPSIVVPHASDQIDNRLVLVSRYIPGRHLSELLIRRGRYPAAVVWDIGRQLLDALIALAERDAVHGDIRPGNVRLTAGGVAVLVDAGVQPALSPELTAHSQLSPERYDGIAPELISTGQAPDERSDLYALGCLLWQLLAGRPPYPGGDPLGKLAAHQTRRIQDVREWAPDCPPQLAESIRALTDRDPARRPDPRALLQQWGYSRRATRRRLSRFVASFNSPARASVAARPARRGRWLTMLLLLFVISGATMTLADRGAATQLLRLITHLPESAFRPTTAATLPAAPVTPEVAPEEFHPAESPPRVAPSGSLLPLPVPDEHGVIVLDSPGPYAVADISTVGPLVIRGTGEFRPEIHVLEEPLAIWAAQVRLENIHVRASRDEEAPPTAARSLLLVQTQHLALHNCHLETGRLPAGEGNAPRAAGRAAPIAVAWRMLDPTDQSGGVVEFENVLAAGGGSLLHVSGTARRIVLRNCLQLAGRLLVNLSGTSSKQLDLLLKLESVTCREGGALVRWHAPQDVSRHRLSIEADDCVFALADEAALFEFVTANSPEPLLSRVRMTGEGSLAPPGLTVAHWLNPATRTREPLESDELSLEGISTGEFAFRGGLTAEAADAEIDSYQAPRRSPNPPGIQAARLQQRGIRAATAELPAGR